MSKAGRNTPLLNATRVLVVIPGCPGLRGLADAMRDQGAACQVLDTDQDFTDLAAIEAAVARAKLALGGIDTVVLAVGNAQSREAQPMVALSPEQWSSALLAPLRTSRHCLQAVWRALTPGTASVVLIGPNFSLTGAGGFAALSALSEAQRAMMKSAARQWGGQGIRLNWLGLDPTVFAGQLLGAAFPLSPEMGPPPPALGYVPGIETGVAQTIAMLISARAVTGASIPVDGGVWMVP